MLGDIRKPISHEHRWHFLQTRAIFEAVNPGDSDLFKQVDYAYFICNGCPDTDGEPNVIKKEVTTVNGN